MKTTDKDSCLILVSLLVKHGVRHVVISPGSRNAPLVVALAQCDAIEKTVVIDERSAAFIALGKASIVDGAVALVCTSGTAVLNYAPAIAEAYYRKLPLVVVSADRPMEWIDQDDSQTLRQYEALSHYVKRSYNIPSRCDNDTSRWYVNRVVNDAMLCALSGRRAPVHINLQLDEPLNVRKPAEATYWTERFIGLVAPGRILTDSELTHLVERLSSPNKVLVIGGFHKPDALLNESLGRLAMMPNVTVLCESIANIHNRLFIDSIDSTLSILDDEGKRSLTPDVVITFGGALVSRFVKQYLRNYRVGEHWHVGMTDNTIDCFQSLTLRIDMEAGSFFAQIADAMRESVDDSDYSARWHEVAREARLLHDKYVSSIPWSDMSAMSAIMSMLPHDCNLQLSNGTSIRYAQLFSSRDIRRSDCNRGVSGIDGCTSTAIGASTVYDGVTVLITGDMSAQYDIGALTVDCIPPRFKMIVMCNGGGGIFRFISSTSNQPELEEYFVVKRHFPLRQMAEAYGFRYFEADSVESLRCNFQNFMEVSDRPSIMAVHTPAEESAEVLRGYFKRHAR